MEVGVGVDVGVGVGMLEAVSGSIGLSLIGGISRAP